MNKDLLKKWENLQETPPEIAREIFDFSILTGSSAFCKEGEDVDLLVLNPDLADDLSRYSDYCVRWKGYPGQPFVCLYFKFPKLDRPVNLLVFRDTVEFTRYRKATETLVKLKNKDPLWDELMEIKDFRIRVFEAICNFQDPNYNDNLLFSF